MWFGSLTGFDERAASNVAGVDVMTAAEAAVEVLRYPTAGMSGGFVSPPTWRDRIVPMLTARFASGRN